MGVTIRDVARAAGVSVTTASRALNGKDDVKPATCRRVQAAAAQLGYVADSVARGLVLGQTRTLGVVVADNANPVYAAALRGIEYVVNQAGYGLLLANSAESQDQALRGLATLAANRVAGVILTPVQTDYRDIDFLRQKNIPFIFLLRHFPHTDFDYVIVDHAQGGYMVTRHLLETGRRRIGHINGPAHVSSGAGRLAGYQRALAEAGIPFKEQWLARASFTVAGGYHAALQLLQHATRPDAIFAANDLQAAGVLKAARELGLKVPDDLAVAGGDDIELAEFLLTPLTTFRVPLFDLGVKAAEIVIGRLEKRLSEPQQVVFPPELVIRESSVGRSEK